MSPTSAYSNQQQQGYQNRQPYDDYEYQSLPNYAVGNSYNEPDRNVNAGYNYAQEKSPYDMRPQEPHQVTGYSTLPARGSNKENSESFRPVQPNKYPYKSSAGIKLQMSPQAPSGYSNEPNYNKPMSPVSYQNDYNRSDSQYNRQASGGTQRQDSGGYQPSHFRKPTPFQPGGYDTQNGSATPPRLQRQTSSSSQGSNVYESTISSGYQPGTFLPKSDPDEAPPMPPPPTNYQASDPYQQSPYQNEYQPQTPYQRQTSQGQYKPTSPYEERPNMSQNRYQQPQPGMYVDTSGRSEPSYNRQGSNPYGSPYQQRQEPDYYSRAQESSQPQPGLQRQPSLGSQQQPQSYGSPYISTPYDRQPSRDQQSQPAQYGRQSSREQNQPPQSQYGRQSSREQNQLPQPYQKQNYSQSPQSGINSFDDILSPFENFQNSNYCDKLFDRSPDSRYEGDSGIMSDYQSTPRSNTSYSAYSPPQPNYNSQQNLLRPAPPAPPPPAVSPPPPPPPPLPPTEWAPPKRSSPQVRILTCTQPQTFIYI